MKIAIVGAGAMGSIYAALMSDAGNDVWAIDIWREHVEAINSTGLRIEGASGDRTVRTLQATTDLADAGACDLYIIATKASGVEAAAQAVAAHAGPGSLVLTIQNGLGAGERIARSLPSDNVLLGVAEGFGAAMLGPGHARHEAMKRIRIGEMTGGSTERLERLAELWREAGFNVEAYDDIDQLIWEKFVCNVTFSGPCTLLYKTIGEVMADPAAWHLALGCMREAYEAGRAQEINFSFDDPVAYVTAFGERMPDARPSMLLDHLASRPSEIDAINGMACVVGRKLGVPTPYNDVVAAAVRAREEKS